MINCRSRWPRAFLLPLLLSTAAAGSSSCNQPTASLADRDTVLVADVVNTTGDSVFDDGLRSAVTVLCQQSPYFSLVPDPRIQRALQLLQRPADAAVSGDLAREVCQRVGGRATIDTSIASTNGRLVITMEAHDCQTGALLADEEAETPEKDDVLTQLGLAAGAIRRQLGEPRQSRSNYDVLVADATTHSLDALRAYSQGLRARAARGDAAAIPLFLHATDIDPNFALAHAKLGVVYGNVGETDNAREAIARAYALRDKVSEYERLYIVWNHATRVLQDSEAVKSSLENLTKEYPRDFAARNNLGVYYNNQGDLEEALKEYRAAADIAPGEPGPLSNAAYVLMSLGRIDEASDVADRALAVRPDPNLAVTRWVTARMHGSARAAEFEPVARRLAGPEQIAGHEAGLAVWFGQFGAYRKIQDEAAARARQSGDKNLLKSIELGRTITLAAYLGGSELAALRSAAARQTDPLVLAQQVSALAMLGDAQPARAALPRLAKSIAGSHADPAVGVARAYVLMSEGKTSEALTAMQAAIAMNPSAQDLRFFSADLHERAGDLDAAIAGYQSVIGTGHYLGPNPVIPIARFRLSRILTNRGDKAAAKIHLDALLAEWKDADTDFPMLKEARAMRNLLAPDS